ncbi:MAG: anti-sigma factor [Deltaproteobacteria bacterium]|nr:anti-sigma factor [Deltaproteobacteria bacterium]
MTCEQARPLVQAYVDGELDIAKSLEIEAHRSGCIACAREEASLRALHTALSNSTLYHEAPPLLERRVRAALRDARRAEGGRRLALRYYSWVGAAAAAVLVFAIIVKGVLPPELPVSELTAREVVDDHLRSLTENHLTDVLSSNQHTVKPWFDGRLTFTPPVEDLSPEGFPLIGGRLDYLNGHPVAAVVYRRRQHIINLFIAPAENAADTLPQSQVSGGYNIIHWTKSGMGYWAVSSVSADELGRFAQLVRMETRRH